MSDNFRKAQEHLWKPVLDRVWELWREAGCYDWNEPNESYGKVPKALTPIDDEHTPTQKEGE